MKRKTLKKSNRREEKKMKASLASHLTVQQLQLGQISFMPLRQQSSFSNPSRFQNLLESEAQAAAVDSNLPSLSTADVDSHGDEKDFILSQDFFCTPDYITPDVPPAPNCSDYDKEHFSCPKSPEKLKTVKSKRQKQDFSDGTFGSPFGSNLPCYQQILELSNDMSGIDETAIDDMTTDEKVANEPQKNQSYVSQSAVALRCRVMPPPCMKNPYLKDASEIDIDPFGSRRSKCAGLFSAVIAGDGLSRYRTDFHEIEKIGNGNFSTVFKVLKRIDGCKYAVKKSTKQLHQDTERRKALMEVQALAALGSHENIVGYYTSWFENEQLYIQMELCDQSLSIHRSSKLWTEREALEAMHQIAKALQFIHERGIAHLDVKPDNIYVKNGIYKLGDFGCATLIDESLPIEEGDARYMPHEILNDRYDHLDKVDIFSLGAAIFELVRGSILPESGPHFLNLREGKLPLLPGHSVQFQSLLKIMMDPDPVRRPSAKELVESPIFDRSERISKIK
ncbi:hypothetical protein LguiA_011403 [Lonicera macranthoides]